MLSYNLIFLEYRISNTEYSIIHDIEINELFKRYCASPIYVLIDVENNDNLTLPTEAYVSVDEVNSEGVIVKSFKHITSRDQKSISQKKNIH